MASLPNNTFVPYFLHSLFVVISSPLVAYPQAPPTGFCTDGLICNCCFCLLRCAIILCLPTAGEEGCIQLCSSLLALKLYGAENCISHQSMFGRGRLLKEKHVELGRDNVLSILAPSIPTLDTNTEEGYKSCGQSFIPLNQIVCRNKVS